MKYGYARVSTLSQSLDDQIEILKDKKCDVIFKEKFTGTTTNRPEFEKLLKTAKKGDEIVVAKLDRFARNAREALTTVEDLRQRGITLTSLDVGTIDNSPIGKLTFQIFAAFAEFERSLIVSRTVEGKRYARAHDPSFHEGHPYQYSDEQIKLAYDLWTQGNTHKMIESKTGISISTQKKRFRELKAKGIIKEDEQKEQKEKA
jgi:DNA invertase Pin-like site-specific DNA recombinase